MGAVAENPVSLHRFSRQQYEQMIDADVFGPEDRLELLDGEIVEMAPQKSRHATAVRLLENVLSRAFGDGCDIRSQLPLSLSERSEPEPDIAVVRGSPRDYRDAHPATALMIVEVSDATRGYDRGRKLVAYAQAGIGEYWILDVVGETLEVCRQPTGEDYAERRILKAGDAVAPLAAPDAAVLVADVLP
ncbi:MAG: Uma2 family endonuclease [Sulfurisoma sp.]|nr:Uma2 family endonuclease [Sulfurisoma sp.]